MNRSERFKPYCSRRRVAHPPALESFAFVAHSPLLSSPRECTATQRHSNDGQGRCPASILAVVVGFDSPLCLPSTLTASARLQGAQPPPRVLTRLRSKVPPPDPSAACSWRTRPASQVPLRCSRPPIAIAARPATYLASLMPPPLLSPSSPLASEASSDRYTHRMSLPRQLSPRRRHCMSTRVVCGSCGTPGRGKGRHWPAHRPPQIAALRPPAKSEFVRCSRRLRWQTRQDRASAMLIGEVRSRRGPPKARQRPQRAAALASAGVDGMLTCCVVCTGVRVLWRLALTHARAPHLGRPCMRGMADPLGPRCNTP